MDRLDVKKFQDELQVKKKTRGIAKSILPLGLHNKAPKKK